VIDALKLPLLALLGGFGNLKPRPELSVLRILRTSETEKALSSSGIGGIFNGARFGRFEWKLAAGGLRIDVGVALGLCEVGVGVLRLDVGVALWPGLGVTRLGTGVRVDLAPGVTVGLVDSVEFNNTPSPSTVDAAFFRRCRCRRIP
jgi:hypothetical protein